MTISEGLGWLKVLRERHRELLSLRDQNSYRETRRLGSNAEKEVTIEPTYDVKELDRIIAKTAQEIRHLDEAIKKTNAITNVEGYEKDESIGLYTL